MTQRQLLAVAALLAACATAHAEHFQYAVALSGTYSLGGTEGCTPPEFDQPACPRAGSLSGTISFDTPTSGDGVFSITDHYGDITDLLVTLGDLPDAALYGGVEILDGAANGTVETLDGSEYFSFDWASRVATYSYDYGDHAPNGSFKGLLSAVPEPAPLMLVLVGLAGLAGLGRRRTRRALAG